MAKANKRLLDQRAGKHSLIARIRNFIQGPTDEELIEKVRDLGGISPTYQNSIWNGQNGYGMSGMGYAAEIPNLLKDPVVASAVNLLMTTCFQSSADQKIFWPVSKYEVITQALEKFHAATLMQSRILPLGYNVIVWGNLPIKLFYNKDNVLSQFKFIGDYNSVIPIIISGKVIGYLVEGEYHYPMEYVFAQAQYNHDLGGPFSNGLIKIGSAAYGSAGNAVMNLSGGGMYGQNATDTDELVIENEFTLAPSYVANAVRPWRNIKIIEDALLLARLDRSNYFRIFTVNVGSSVTSKAAIQVLNYYRSLFKKARHISYDSNGMASQGGSSEFEVVIPKTNMGGAVDVTDVGGQCLRGNTLIPFKDGEAYEIRYIFEHRDDFIGRQVYTRIHGGSVVLTTLMDVYDSRKDASFVRVELSTLGSFECTADHPCLLHDGTYKPAGALVQNDLLASNTALGYRHPITVLAVTEVPDVVEDAYDLLVASDSHCFAISAGVIVHNSDVRSLRDLDTQYQRLFASLNLQPSQIGFGQGQASNISMGESSEQIWNALWMRYCKSTLFSVLDAVKQIDLYHLRSRGFRVEASDWTYGTVLQTQVDEHERNITLKDSVSNLKALSDVFTGLQIESLDRKYLVSSILGPSISSIGVDVDRLLNGSPAQAPQNIEMGYNLKLEELKQIKSTAELSGVFPMSLIESMQDYVEAEGGVEERKAILSNAKYLPPKLQFMQLQNGVSYLTSPDTEIELSSVFSVVDEVPANIWPFQGRDMLSTINVNSVFMVPKLMGPIYLKDITSSFVAPIGSAIMVTPTKYILTEREDVLTVLHLKLENSFTAIVQHLYYIEG
jgi:hypothetical protein